MATDQIGIKLSLEGASQVTGGLGSVVGKLGDLDSATAKVGDAFKSMGIAALAAVGVGSLAAIKTMVTGYIDAAEALKDLSIKTGASVESLSAFESIGKLTGTTVDTVATAMTRLAKNMAVANEDSKGVGQAIKALGLNFEQLRSMKPDEQLVTIARAMAEFQDGSGKAAVAMTLFGKSGADLLPFMKDLAAAGQLQAKVTQEQADMADLYNDAITKSRERTDDLKRSLALGLLPTLITVHDLTLTFSNVIREYLSGSVRDATDDFDGMKLVIRTLGTVFEAVIVLASDVAFVIKGIGREIGGIVAQFSALGEGGGIFSSEGRDAWTRVGEEMRADAKKSREELDKFQASILGTTDRILQQRDALKNHSLSSAENTNELERMGKMHGATGTKVLDFKAATEESNKALEAAIKKGQEFLESLDLQLAALNSQVSAGRELTKTEEALVKLEQDLRSGKVKLTEAEVEIAKLKLQEIDTLKQVVEQQKASEKATLAAAQAKVKEFDALSQSNDKLGEEITAQKAANDTLQTGIDYTGRLAVEKLKEAAATAERRALVALERDDNEALAEQYRAQAKGLRDLAELKEQGIQIKTAQEAAKEWQKTTDSINNGLTDALMRAFESGKGFMEAFRQTLVNAFKTLVLEPTIKAIIAPVGSAVGTLFGANNAMAAGNAASGGSGLSSLGSFFGLGSASGLGSIFQSGAQLALNGGSMLGLEGAGSMMANGSFLQGAAQGAGVIGGWAGPIAIGQMVGRGISGGYSAIGGNSSTAVNAGTIIGAIVGGPIGAGIGAAIGGVVNRAFGMQAKEMKDYGITGSFSGGAATGRTYQDWYQKGGWFRSDRSGTDYSALSDNLAAALDAGAKAVLDQTKGWAQALKLPADELAAVTTNFTVKLTNDQKANEAALSLVFEGYQRALTDRFAQVIGPFQKAGETVGDAMQRLATLNAFSESINQLGGIFGRIASASIDARENIIGLAGGIDKLVAASAQFVSDYYTQAEQAGLRAKETLATLNSLGINGAGLGSRDDFRRLVESLDISTAQGQQQLVSLLQLGPQFAQLADYLKEQNKTLAQVAGQAPTVSVLEQLVPGQNDTTSAVVDLGDQIKEGNATLERIANAIKDGNVAIAAGLDALAKAQARVNELQARANEIAASTNRAITNGQNDAALANSQTGYVYNIGAGTAMVSVGQN